MVFSFLPSRAKRRNRLDVAPAVEACVGRIPLAGRYHRKPRRIEYDYDISADVLGSGMNGHVALATSKTSPEQKFAIKTIQVKHDNKSHTECLKSEVQNYLCLDHPHITRLHAVYETEEHFHLVMECMEGGDMFDRLKQKVRFSEDEARDACRQILLALSYMHSHGIVHRDVKLENFVYARKDESHLKLIDFGLSTMWSPFSAKKMNAVLGTLSYAAPEVFHKSYTSQCDLWSLGVVGFTVLSGSMPFRGIDVQQRASICAGRYQMNTEGWHGVSTGAKEFIQSLLTVNPRNRFSAQQALHHHWIANCFPSSRSDLTGVLHNLRDFSQVSTFRRRCMKVLALSLSHEQQTNTCDLFLSLDTSWTGTVTRSELRSIMAERLQITNESEIQRIFGALDDNHDQEIHYSDFLAAMVGNMIDIEDYSLRSAFRAFDKDGSGCITTSNLLDVLGCSDEKRVHAFMQEADLQNHGYICFADFAELLRSKSPTHVADYDPKRDISREVQSGTNRPLIARFADLVLSMMWHSCV